MADFAHLHLHTQYSILDGASNISKLISKVKKDGMKAAAITDHGNMFGVKLFHKTAKKEGIKPILGCEVYVARNSRHETSKQEDRSGNHLIILAKNKIGYHNLVKLVSKAWTDGFYYKPRIDEDLLFKHSEGLIISSACLAGVVSQSILKGNIEKAEEKILKYKEIFGEDYYLELQRHKTGDPIKDAGTFEEQQTVNEAIVKLSEKLGVKYIATNDVHYINKEDAEAHDILIALSTGKDLDDPSRMRYSGEEYVKTQSEMKELFSDLPDALATTNEIADKVEEYDLDRDPVMPEFPLPAGFEDEGEYLKHITYEGAKERWGELDDKLTERIDFELDTILRMGFPGYFLITWDFIKAAREMDVSVGPGRGSAAGSAVAYCLKITDIDPIKYGLLFERFLNPDRISMPDIDIDFDEDGRERILKWVVDKYGKNRVANIITFGSMAAKSSIKDVARVLKLPLPESERLAKMIPEKPGTTLQDAFKQVSEFKQEKSSSNPLIVDTIKFAETLEGSIRQTGVHACGIIISKEDLENYIPVSTSKASDLYVTQYEGKHVEDVGMLKMDFLGLKTLSIIKDAVENVKLSKGIDIDIDNVPLEDEKTYEVYAKGETTSLFQFESDGMKKHLRNLKPTRFEDLIAMNALYRPGPMEYIPSFIARKHGKEKIAYDLPEMEEYLKNTYGITVYQEQVMQLSQKLAGFTKGQADSLRKAMGKKIIAMMNDLKGKFLEGAANKGHDTKITEKIWKDWEAFAQYAFNKSHSTCYAYVSYQTAYLKAHHPAEYMAAVLSRNLSNIKKVTLFMDECRRMGLKVLGPSVNESFSKFNVNKKGEIRFGLGAVKGVGDAAVSDIVKERNANGEFKDYFDFIERVNLSTVNKRTIESLVMAGAFDNVDQIKRSCYFALNTGSDLNFIEESLKYGNKIQGEENANQNNLFGEENEIEIKKPDFPKVDEWDKLYRLNKEKELVGIYISEHPLDDFKLEINAYCNCELADFNNLSRLKNTEIKIAGIVKDVQHATTKTGKPYGSITIEDYSSSHRIMMFGKDYLNFKKYFTVNYVIILAGKVQHRFGNPDQELEFKVTEIEMFSEMKDKMIKSIAVKVPIGSISDNFINNISALTQKHKGDKNIHFLIYEPESKVWVKMFSKSHKINITEEFIFELENKHQIEYKIF